MCWKALQRNACSCSCSCVCVLCMCVRVCVCVCKAWGRARWHVSGEQRAGGCIHKQHWRESVKRHDAVQAAGCRSLARSARVPERADCGDRSARTECRPLSRMARNSCSRMKVPMKMVMTKKMATQGVMDCGRAEGGKV